MSTQPQPQHMWTHQIANSIIFIFDGHFESVVRRAAELPDCRTVDHIMAAAMAHGYGPYENGINLFDCVLILLCFIYITFGRFFPSFDHKTKCISNIMGCEERPFRVCLRRCRSLVVNLSATKLLHRQPHSSNNFSHHIRTAIATVANSCFCPISFLWRWTLYHRSAARLLFIQSFISQNGNFCRWSAYDFPLLLLLPLPPNKDRNKYFKSSHSSPSSPSSPSLSRPHIFIVTLSLPFICLFRPHFTVVRLCYFFARNKCVAFNSHEENSECEKWEPSETKMNEKSKLKKTGIFSFAFEWRTVCPRKLSQRIKTQRFIWTLCFAEGNSTHAHLKASRSHLESQAMPNKLKRM